mmetsp:Transcript_107471/g.272700  ORF Transcript_107471/g.272700 Transcript_107471/m.272700 type:complete len:203 (-) Transcript_107471:468-1076(-)
MLRNHKWCAHMSTRAHTPTELAQCFTESFGLNSQCNTHSFFPIKTSSKMRTAAAQDLTIDSLWRQFQRSRLLARRRNSSTQRRITTDCWLDVCTIPRSSARSISRATHWSLRLSSATNFECTCAGVRSDARGKERPRIWSEDEEGEHGCKRRQRFADLPGEVSQAWVARRRAPCRHCTAMQREATPSGLLRDASARAPRRRS